MDSNQLIYYFNKYYIMEGDLTHEQFETVLKLCDILGLEDFTVAAMMLKEVNWKIQKALDIEQPTVVQPNPINVPKVVPQIKQPVQQYEDMNYENIQNQPISYDFEGNQQVANQYEYEYEYYQKQFDRIERIEQKKKKFDEGFPSLPLLKTKSQCKDVLQHKLNKDKQIISNYNIHRAEYQKNLLENSSVLCDRILNSKMPQKKKYEESIKKNQNNRNFLTYLHKKYDSKINFTFGTFLLNLARSYLDKKFLLVYIHKSQFEENKSIKMLLTQKQISDFVNKNCICYGMFDSSDDYDILHNYVQMRNLPAFALFKLNKKQLKEQFISEYPVLQSQPQNFLEWLASKIGVVLKKKPKNTENVMTNESEIKKIQMSNIIYEQNLEYQQMEKLYELKRNQSKMRKQSIETKQMQIQQMKQKFKEEPNFEIGKTIQIRFRLPVSGNSITRVFKTDDKILILFEYIHCFGREQFEEKFADFDLTQTFPRLSLEDKKEQTISQIFIDSERQNIIVKEL